MPLGLMAVHPFESRLPISSFASAACAGFFNLLTSSTLPNHVDPHAFSNRAIKTLYFNSDLGSAAMDGYPDHVAFENQQAMTVGTASGRIHNDLCLRPLKLAGSPPNKSLLTPHLTSFCDNTGDQRPRKPRQASNGRRWPENPTLAFVGARTSDAVTIIMSGSSLG